MTYPKYITWFCPTQNCEGVGNESVPKSTKCAGTPWNKLQTVQGVLDPMVFIKE